MFTETERRCIVYFGDPNASTNARHLAASLDTTPAYAYRLIRRLELRGALKIKRYSTVQGGRGYKRITVTPEAKAAA